VMAWGGGLWAGVVGAQGSCGFWIYARDDWCGCMRLLAVAERNSSAWVGRVWLTG
jgi:hypothetical protein